MTDINPVKPLEQTSVPQNNALVQKKQNDLPNSLFQDGPAKSNDELNKAKDYNLYGNDFANFSKFKGNDKHDAMRITNAAAADVKKALMQLQHEFPGMQVALEPMPDPQKCGKKREGFFTYQQQLDNWKDLTMRAISDCREKSTTETVARDGDKTRATVVGMGAAVIQNDNENAELLFENENRNADEINENINKESARTRGAVYGDGEKTRKLVKFQGEVTRANTSIEADYTRNTVNVEADKTRDTVIEEGDKTRKHNEDITLDVVKAHDLFGVNERAYKKIRKEREEQERNQ